MKKLGFISLTFLVVMCICLIYINFSVGDMVDYKCIPIDYNGYKNELSAIDSQEALNEFLQFYKAEEAYYDSEYFNDNMLIAAVITEPSKSIKHEVLSVLTRDDTMFIRIKRNIPDKISTIKSTKIYLIEIERDKFISTGKAELMFIR